MVTKFKVFIFITFLLLQARNIVYAQYWELIPGSPTNVSSMTCDANGNLWAGTDNGYMYLYNDTIWEEKENGRISQGSITSIAVAPNGDIYYSGGSSLYMLTNGGTVFYDVFNTGGTGGIIIHDIVINNTGAVYFASYGRGVFYPSGGNWASVGNELSNRRVNSLDLVPNGTFYAGTDGRELYRSTDGEVNWLPLNSANAEITCFAVVDNNIIFAAASENGILKSTDAGQSWTRCDPTIFGRTTYAYNIIYNSTTEELFAHINQYSSYGSVLMSTDLGQNWVLQERGLPTIATSYNSDIFSFNPTTGETYLAVSRVNGLNGVYRFVPVGELPIDTNSVRVVIKDTYKVKPNGTVRISVDAIDNLTNKNAKEFSFTLRYNKRILSYENASPWGMSNKLSWSLLDYSTPGELVFEVTNPTEEPLTGTGSLIDIDFFGLGGDSCGTHLMLESFTFSNIGGPNVITHNGYCELFGRCGGEAIYVTRESTPLYQNNPNPIREGYESTIQYRVNVAGETNITVYDVLGREVTKLVNEYKSEGIYSVNFNTKGLSSGVYFYKLRAPGYEGLKKMVIIR